MDYDSCCSMPVMFFEQAARLGDKPFLWAKHADAYQAISWAEAARDVRGLSLGLRSLGITLRAGSLDRGGQGGGDVARDTRDNRGRMKKYPSDGAHERAKALRREKTEAEKKIWQRLRSQQTEGYRFRRQVPFGRIIADFVCYQARLIVEIDCGQHDLSSEREVLRTRFLESQGYHVLRFWNNQVQENPDGVHTVIARELALRSPPPHPPPSRA
jgi:very-short-patch-repair endonuclease